MKTIEELEQQRKEALDTAEAIYYTPISPNYRDNERYSWAVKSINYNIDTQIKELKKDNL